MPLKEMFRWVDARLHAREREQQFQASYLGAWGGATCAANSVTGNNGQRAHPHEETHEMRRLSGSGKGGKGKGGKGKGAKGGRGYTPPPLSSPQTSLEEEARVGRAAGSESAPQACRGARFRKSRVATEDPESRVHGYHGVTPVSMRGGIIDMILRSANSGRR